MPESTKYIVKEPNELKLLHHFKERGENGCNKVYLLVIAVSLQMLHFLFLFIFLMRQFLKAKSKLYTVFVEELMPKPSTYCL